MRSEMEIEGKIDMALREREAQGHGDAQDGYLRGVREALGWVLEEDDTIPGLDDD